VTGSIRDLSVSPLGLGTMALTGRGTWGAPADPAAARSLLRRAAELGVQIFDTADSYGPEVAENLVREALYPYDGLLIATKGGFRRHGPHEWEADCRPEVLREACESSLRRLGVEQVDLYQLHVVDRRVPVEESVGALADLQRAGKIRHIGVCNVDLAELDRAREVAAIVSVQNRLSLAERASLDVLARCVEAGLAFIAWAPLAKGFLSGASGALASVARDRGATPAQVALAWLLRRGAVAIPGTSSVRHLEENAGALAIELSKQEAEALEGDFMLGYRANRLARKARIRAGRIKAGVRRVGR
jgi:aryl-alcohol dehydrogenase-like predicted oxidoreductase